MNWEQDDTFLGRWLNNTLSEEERTAFEDSEEGKEFIRLAQASSMIEPKPYNVEEGLIGLQQRISSQKAPEKKQIWLTTGFQLAVAASVALVIALVLLFPSARKITTGTGEQELAVLPDGSEVRLNAVSSISYDPSSWNEARLIDLKGEAFFDVRKGASFLVKTVNGNVEVLGTSFNVKSRGNAMDVACYTGRVEVTASNVTRQLTPGASVRIQDGELVAYKEATLQGEPSWTMGITELENMPLASVLQEITIVFGLDIEYDGTLDHLTYTGAFPNQRPESALKLIFEPLNVDYSFDLETKKLVIIGLK